MKRLQSTLHGVWIGGVAGIIAGALSGICLMTINSIMSRGTIEPLGSLIFGLYGGVVGLPFGLFAGTTYALLFSTLLDPRHAVQLGTLGGAFFGAIIGGSFIGSIAAGLFRNAPVDNDLHQTLTRLGIILLGAVTGAFAGRIGGRLFTKYTDSHFVTDNY